MSPDDSDIAEGIIPEKLPEHISPPSTEFLAWHRVRKQYIRHHQWNELARRNVDNQWRADLQRPSSTAAQAPSAMHVVRPLRCLVIPGNHLLDVRSMWNEISPLDCFIRYLGFNEGQGSSQVGTDVHVANNAVTSLAGVVPDSQVIRDRFETIGGDNTFAFRRLKEYGPYHIVNLDLCRSMFPNTEQSVDEYYTALNALLKYQFEYQKASWLLFITTMIKPAAMDKEGMQALCKPTRDNFANSDFLEILKKLVQHDSLEGVQGENVNLDGLTEEGLIHLFGVAFGKWLLRLGQTASPKWTVEMRRSYRYSINEEKGAVMLSLAYEMTPNFAPPVDATGMSKLPITNKQFPSEAQSALKLAESVGNIKDVDKELALDAAMKAVLLEKAADLMASAGFDRAKYVKWVNKGEVVAQE